MTDIAIWVLWGALALATVMSVAATVRLPAGWARVCDFPRVQIMTVGLVAAALLLFATGSRDWSSAMAAVLAISIMVQQLRHILPYSRLWPKQSADSAGITPDSTLKVLVSNVLQTNTRYELLIDQIEKRQPDVLVVMEVDDSWIRALRKVTASFAHRVEVPLDNTYGIALYSKVEIDPDCVTYLVRPDVPSLVTTCRLASGRQVQLIAVHPEPPMPHETSIERDAEIFLAGLIAANEPLPTIVTGDLNDVAWSHTTRRFRRISGLLDPRIGRGMYNTFHAGIPFLRWPLDHLFHDPAFTVKALHRLPNIGSDHFPILFELQLLPEDAGTGTTPDPVKLTDAAEAGELLDAVSKTGINNARATRIRDLQQQLDH